MNEMSFGVATKIVEEAGFEGYCAAPDRWVGRVGDLLMEIAGNPVNRVSLMAPPDERFAMAINLQAIALGMDSVRPWISKMLGGITLEDGEPTEFTNDEGTASIQVHIPFLTVSFLA